VSPVRATISGGLRMMLRYRRTMAIVSAGAVLTVTPFIPLPANDFAPWAVQSLRVVDRNGIVLREFPNDQQGRGAWCAIGDIAIPLQLATIAVEDRRFSLHPGVDPIAVLRSVADNIRAMQFRSGGSTLTQQVIRNVYHGPRTVTTKIVEMWDALRLERMMTKSQVLEQYLNRAPYGNQLYGVEAAARWYFGKPAREVSLAEAAFLAGLPNSPTALNPHKNLNAALARQRKVLHCLIDQQRITQEEYDRALAQPVQIIPPEAHFRAPHVAAMVASLGADGGTVTTTIDYPLQQQVQWIARGHLRKLLPKNVHNSAIVVIENSTGEIRALLGSADFFDSTHQGQVNGVLAQRQPGSAIKPFMYTLTLEHGLTPASILADIPTALPDHHGDYVPENYDRRFHGPVRLRTALACSYNVPAVRAFQTIGKPLLLEKLRELGFSSMDENPEFYGYGLTLGNAEVSLLELTTAYMSLANGGVWKPALLLPEGGAGAPGHRVYTAAAAYLITDILKDGVARRPAFGSNFHFPFPCAVKTGTTKDYKDNWTVGYTSRYTVGVWVGNFDGQRMRQVSGVSGAGPIFTDVIMFMHSPPYGLPSGEFSVPEHLTQRTVCARSGKVPTRLCEKTINEWFIDGMEPGTPCDVHQEFVVRTPDGRERTQTYEIFPPEYRQWAAIEGMPLPPPGARRVARRGDRGEHVDRLTIVSPNPGDYFKIDPVLRREYQSITIAGYVPRGVTDVHLRVNGALELPFDNGGVQWQLKQGVFRFQLSGIAENMVVVSAPVVINVE
jgi:penicillin-binding protein 1C